MRSPATAALVLAAIVGCANLSGLSSGEDAGAGVDASSDIPEGGLPSQPGFYDCPSPTECPLANSYCCFTRTQYECVAVTAQCSTSAAHCKEKADCPGSQVCCLHFADGGAESACEDHCTIAPQSCRTNAECSGGQCLVQRCRGILFAEYCNAPNSPAPACQ